MEDKVHRFVAGLGTHLIDECTTAALQPGAGQSSKASGSQYRPESGQMRPLLPWCTQCGKLHAIQCRWGSNAYYACGQPGHVMRQCLMRGGVGIIHITGFVVGSSSAVCPSGQGSQTLAGRGRGRNEASNSSGPQHHVYALG
ncbi:uncharacterized protein LOC132053704 [Lycium ferocissimum]|uniref:uncharacterized protein LOC132053704 n=1 Tax=Lycium ferocissimum TaxID=112874 RepID=UPI0028153672|nr:uncharacterized protein LOC132053704 [Lycium ferocissimum]